MNDWLLGNILGQLPGGGGGDGGCRPPDPSKIQALGEQNCVHVQKSVFVCFHWLFQLFVILLFLFACFFLMLFPSFAQ